METGDILCIKTTGELVTVLTVYSTSDEVDVRRPVSGRDGISHEKLTLQTVELETEEQHLNREANAMILKVKIQKELDKQLRALDPVEKESDPLVN